MILMARLSSQQLNIIDELKIFGILRITIIFVMTLIMMIITFPESGDGTDKVWSGDWITGGAAEAGHQIHAVRSYIMMSLLSSMLIF